MEKILFALCEGPHDVAFLYRILQVNGLQKYSKPIGEFPAPLNKYFASEAAGENLEQLETGRGAEPTSTVGGTRTQR